MSYVQIIGWHDYFVPPSLQIFHDGTYFVFNCGENSQRFRLSNKLGLAKIKYIFLTNLNTHSFSGLPSFILSLDGCNTSQVTIFGPKPIKEVLNKLLSTFLELKIKVIVIEVDNEDAVELVKCSSMTIYGFTYNSETKTDFLLDPLHFENVGYFIEFDKVPGSFIPELAEKLGVSKGPDIGMLKKGFDVTLVDGTVVNHEQVCDQPTPGNQMIILDDSYDYTKVKNLNLDESRLIYLFYLHNGEQTSKKHINCNQTSDDLRYVVFPPYYQRNFLYHSIFPSLFPELYPETFEKILTQSFEELFQVSMENLKGGFSGRGPTYPPLTKLFVHPPKKYEPKEHEKIDFEVDLEGPKLTFLGTGCSVPSVYRNVSSILLQIYEDQSILLDAGEGTVLQLLYTCENFDEFVEKLVSISHADHHLGLYFLLALQKKYKSKGSKTLVVCSEVVLKWLKTFNKHIFELDFESLILKDEYETLVLLDNNTVKLSFFKVDHIFDSFGIKIEHEEIGTVIYSGDTKPCKRLMDYAHDVDILIHEATFTDEYMENANKTCHTTISEAIDIAVKCNVKNLFVTHFSQRFQYIPNDYNLTFNLVMAFDLMTVPIKKLDELAPHLKKFGQIVKELVKFHNSSSRVYEGLSLPAIIEFKILISGLS